MGEERLHRSAVEVETTMTRTLTTLRGVALLAVGVGFLLASRVATAQDELPAASYKCYPAKTIPGTTQFPRGVAFPLADQFHDSSLTRFLALYELCTPVSKDGEEIPNPAVHLMCYKVSDPAVRGRFLVDVTDQFGTESLIAANERTVCLPALKNPQACDPETETCPSLDDVEFQENFYGCYDARPARDTSPLIDPSDPIVVDLADQFETKSTDVYKTHALCNPLVEPLDPERHLKCYDIRDHVDTEEPQTPFAGAEATVVDELSNEFTEEGWQLRLGRPNQLCETATKSVR